MILLKFLKKFFIVAWKTINFLRKLFLNVFVFAIVFFVFGIVSQNSYEQQVLVNDSVLLVNLKGEITEQSPSAKFSFNYKDMSMTPTLDNSIHVITNKIKQATNDEKIKALVLNLKDMTYADMQSLNLMAKALTEFKKIKPIYAIGENFNQSQYYLASLANKIFLFNSGEVWFKGLDTQRLFYGDLLRKLKINVDVFRVGEYKSAVEPYILNKMSKESKVNEKTWVNNLWNNYVNDVSVQRQIDKSIIDPDIKDYLSKVDEVEGDLTNYALKNNLVDNLTSIFEIEDTLNDLVNNLPAISIYDYNLNEPKTDTNNKISIITIDGAITYGQSDKNYAGSDSLISQFYNALDNNASAVVIRINSPGGSAYASEIIRSGIVMLKEKNIPVVISMAGAAASGGYWIASAGDYIFANKNTITGSIGIFSIITTYENSLNEIGINSDGITTSSLGSTSKYKNLTSESKHLYQKTIEHGYKKFINIVSEARKIPVDLVDMIAQGQVWTGEQAKNNGLVDELGDLDDAIKKAAELAKINDYYIDWQLNNKSTLLQLFDDFKNVIKTSIIPDNVLFNTLNEISDLSKLKDPQNRFVLCNECLSLN